MCIYHVDGQQSKIPIVPDTPMVTHYGTTSVVHTLKLFVWLILG